ncbi:MAG: hypothetical protein ABI806_05530 [Candidatus Solibacter sp.]
MTDIFALRTALRTSKANLEEASESLAILQQRLKDFMGPAAQKALLQFQVTGQTKVVKDDLAILNTNTALYQAAVIADPMHSADAGLPLVLLPIRIETAFLVTPELSVDLVVRVYPDDIHVDTHEPELTASELAAGSAYWRAVWGAGQNQSRLDAAWGAVLGQLKPARAAWSVRALRPAEPRPGEETPVDETQPEPVLAEVGSRPGTFNRPARTTLLPDRWRILGLRNDGSEIFYAEGAPIPDTLDLSFSPPEQVRPEPVEPEIDAPASDLPFHEGSRWLVDLDAAIANGMAVRIPLAPPFNIGQLFVLGTSASIPPDVSAARLESALIGHQYTNSLAFLPPGTPTNNTAQTRSAWQPSPPIPSPGEVEAARSAYKPESKQNAAVAAKALGVDGSEVLSIAPSGLVDQQFDVGAVQEYLWPALGGKALSMIYTRWDIPPGGVPAQGNWKSHVDRPFAEALQAHAAGWVRSRGTLPIIRVGNQPYGLLPALSLDNWVTPAADRLAGLVTQLRTLRPYWLSSVGLTARVPAQPSADADSTTVNILQRLPVSVDIRVRNEEDPVLSNKVTAGQLSAAAPIPSLPSNSRLFLTLPSAAPPSPLPVDIVFKSQGDDDPKILSYFRTLFRDAIEVAEHRMTQEEYFTNNAQELDALDRGSEQNRAADLFLSLVLDAMSDPLFPEDLPGDGSAAEFLLDFIFSDDVAGGLDDDVQRFLPVAKAFFRRFDALCAVNPDQYVAAIRETLDVFSHRLDAWITSLAARRLDEMRTQRQSGLVIGAYGWVENLSPKNRDAVQHYIHAPSMSHAATAAVLRAGYESHDNAGPLAVNLVSRRVRNADSLAAGIRNGQPLGALLGYRFERGLHEAHLDRLIFTLRTKHPLPLPAVPLGAENAGVSLEAIAARTVVDGLDLLKKRALVSQELAAAAVADHRLALTVAETNTFTALLEDLSDVLDSFGDLLLAESVHHLVGGNPLRAGLTADTAGRGEPVPDRFDVTLAPRSGRSFTWQLGALLPVDFQSAATGWNIGRPRAAAEPHAEAWAATMLGDAGSWLVSCTLTTAGEVADVSITLDQLGVCALDVIAESAGDPSQLELRIAEAVSGGMPEGTVVSFVRTQNSDSPGFGELVNLAGRIRAVLGKATPLAPQHLQGADSSTVAGINVGDLDARAAALGTSLSNAVQTLQDASQALAGAALAEEAPVLAAIQTLRSALIVVADHGVPAAWPVGGTGIATENVSALNAQAASLLPALRRLAATVRPNAPLADGDTLKVTAWLGAVTEYMQAILGAGIPVLPAYLLPPDSPYASALAAGAAPVDVSGVPVDAAAAMLWLRRISRVRANCASLHDVLLAAEALQVSTATITVAQLPDEAGARWAALPFTDAKPPKARIGLVFSTPAPIDSNAAFCGFVCDTWTEQLPGLTAVATGERKYEASEVTGMAFKVDTPDAAAPQAVLLAIAPDPARGWSFDILLDTVKETLELAKIRPVDLGDLYRFGRVLPAIHSSGILDRTLNDAAKAAGGNH